MSSPAPLHPTGNVIYPHRNSEERSIQFDQLCEEEEEKWKEKEEAGLMRKGHGGDEVLQARGIRNRVLRHWVIQGLTSNGVGNAFKKNKEAVTMYYPPSPPEGSDAHRYVLLLFKERHEGYSIPPNAPEHDDIPGKRGHWNAMHFAEQNMLKLVGATYFTVEVKRDDDV